jgi:glycine cleavage system aminomethyltransferase T
MAGVEEQFRAASEAAVAVAAPELAVLVVTGGDRVSWLNGLVTCDLAKARVGDVVYGLAVAKSGRVIADLFAVIEAERLALVVPRASAAALRASLERASSSHLALASLDAKFGLIDDARRELDALARDNPGSTFVADLAAQLKGRR